MDVSIIIVNYNTTGHLKNCLESIINYSENILFEIIVVDNNSPDREIESYKQIYQNVIFLYRDVNDGFGAGCNFGARIAKGKYLFFVNPDIVVKNNIVYDFFNFMNTNDDVILCSGLLEDNKGNFIHSYNYFPSLKYEIKEAFTTNYKNFFGSLLNRKEIQNNTVFEIDYPIGAMLFLKKENFEKINGFDKRYFLYSEDCDLAVRLKALGGKIICIPYLRAFHYYNSTVDDLKSRELQARHIFKSKLIYFYKHFSFWERYFIRIVYIFSYTLRLLYIPLNKSHNHKLKVFKQMFAGYCELFKIIKL